jgi:hypothetical protein
MAKDDGISVTDHRRLWEEGLASGQAQERQPLPKFLKAARAKLAEGRPSNIRSRGT